MNTFYGTFMIQASEAMSSCYQQQTVMQYTKGQQLKVPHYIFKVLIAMTEQHKSLKWSSSR